jgi:hypothetical protein
MRAPHKKKETHGENNLNNFVAAFHLFDRDSSSKPKWLVDEQVNQYHQDHEETRACL